MESIPDIRMRCPKCGKDFPMDAVYCDDCSAMLEPVEQEQRPASLPESPAKAGAQDADTTLERIEDVALDTLKAGVEQKFFTTLLLELDQTRRRLEKKEGVLAGLMERQPSMEHGDLVSRSGRIEAEIDGLIKKIAKLESMLENLTEKIRADISGLEGQLSGLARPGISGMFGSAGRYHRMLSSELTAKRSLLRMLSSRRPPAFPTFMRLKPVLIPLIVLLGLAAAGLAVYWSIPDEQPAPVHATRPAGQRPGLITGQEISRLLDDIRKANLSKDLSLWESRYSRSYLGQKGKREGIMEQWAKVDYKSLTYTVDEIRAGAAAATAVVTWNMELISKADGGEKIVVQQLLADLVREDGVLKIAAVRKQ